MDLENLPHSIPPAPAKERENEGIKENESARL
jgi:hypothetical protein